MRSSELHVGAARVCTLVAVAWLSMSAVVPTWAHAADETPQAADQEEAKGRARALFERGIAAYKEGRFKDAIDAFLDAHRQYPNPVLSFNAARAYERLGDSAGALRFYREYLRQSPDAADRNTVSERVKEHEGRLAARGVQQVTIASTPSAATVVLDGTPVGVTPWTGEIAPGSHEVRLRREGYDEAVGELVLPKEKAVDLSLQLEKKKAVAEKPGPVVPTAAANGPEDRAPDGARIGVVTWTAFGVGAAALGGALAFELMRGSAEDDVKNEPTQLARADAFDRMESRQTTARILAGVGAAAVVAGGVLLYLDLSRDEKPGAAVPRRGFRSGSRLGVGCAPGGCGALVEGKF